MAPTLMQTLLRQPSQSYADKTHDVSLYQQTQFQPRQGSRARSIGNISRASSRASSIRSGHDQFESGTITPSGSVYSTTSTSRRSSTTTRQGDWVDGNWQWSMYGGRRGLTSGANSIHPSEVASALGVPSSRRKSNAYTTQSEAGDTRSIRSSSSFHSVRSSVSRRSTSMNELGNAAHWSKDGLASTGSKLSLGAPKTSRRYSDLVTTVQAAPPSVTPSASSQGLAAPSSRRKSSQTSTTTAQRSPLRRTDSPGSEAPSLASSLSSAASSPPITPIAIEPLDSNFPIMADFAQPKRSKRSSGSRSRTRDLSLAHMESVDEGMEGVDVGAIVVTALEQPRIDISQAPVTMPTKIFSVDEVFATASVSSGDEVKSTKLNDRAETPSSDDDDQQEQAMQNANDIPRISLTRSASDQSAMGIKGDVDVTDTSADEELTRLSRKASARKSKIAVPQPINEVASAIEVVASSNGRTAKRSKSTSELPAVIDSQGAHVAGSAVQDANWSKRTRALGDAVESTSLVAPQARKGSRSTTSQPQQLHWTVQQYQQRQEQQLQQPPVVQSSPRRPSSLGNLRRPPLELEPMPEMDETEDSSAVSKNRLDQAKLQQAVSETYTNSSSRDHSQARHNSTSGSRSRSPPAGTQRRAQSFDDYTTPRPSSPPLVVPYAPRPGPPPIMPIVTQAPPATTMYTIPPPTSPLPFQIPTAADQGWSHHRAMSATSDAPSMRSDSGYSTLSMPTGAFRRPPKNPQRAVNRNSLALSGQTLATGPSALMSTLSVSATALVRGPAAGSSSSGGFGSLFRRMEPPLASSAAVSARFDPLRDLTFGTLAPPPKKCRDDEVQVQVIAVGLDRLDVERAKDMAGRADGFGWIPGRCFYGKVLETGVDVSRVKRGELVFGSTPLKKSGALADIVVVHRDRLALAPINSDLSVEQMAILPSAGVLAGLAMERLCRELPKGSKIFILNGHEGVGQMCMQLAGFLRPNKDLYMVAHCPLSVDGAADACYESGASHVVLNDTLAALNGLHESEFDVVIDTIGGRRIYDASRRVLHHSGTFITTLGDSSLITGPSAAPLSSSQYTYTTISPASNSSTSVWKTSLRSLRRTFVKKDRKRVAYVHLAPEADARAGATGRMSDAPPRELLDRLRAAAEAGCVRPRVEQTYAFESAAKAFKEGQPTEGRVVRVLQV